MTEDDDLDRVLREGLRADADLLVQGLIIPDFPPPHGEQSSLDKDVQRHRWQRWHRPILVAASVIVVVVAGVGLLVHQVSRSSVAAPPALLSPTSSPSGSREGTTLPRTASTTNPSSIASARSVSLPVVARRFVFQQEYNSLTLDLPGEGKMPLVQFSKANALIRNVMDGTTSSAVAPSVLGLADVTMTNTGAEPLQKRLAWVAVYSVPYDAIPLTSCPNHSGEVAHPPPTNATMAVVVDAVTADVYIWTSRSDYNCLGPLPTSPTTR